MFPLRCRDLTLMASVYWECKLPHVNMFRPAMVSSDREQHKSGSGFESCCWHCLASLCNHSNQSLLQPVPNSAGRMPNKLCGPSLNYLARLRYTFSFCVEGQKSVLSKRSLASGGVGQAKEGQAEGRMGVSCVREKAAGLMPQPQTFCSLKEEPAPQQPKLRLQHGWGCAVLREGVSTCESH